MSGSKNAAAGRASGDVGWAAFFAAYSSSEHETLVPDSPVPQRDGVRAADDWPLCSYLELGAFHSAVPCARLHARQILWEWDLAELSEAVELLVSELTTNAVQVSQSLELTSPIRLWLLSDQRRVIVSVWDSSPLPPARIDMPEDAEGGRGLLIVEAVSERWGWYSPRDIGGKCVWCEVARQQVQ